MRLLSHRDQGTSSPSTVCETAARLWRRGPQELPNLCNAINSDGLLFTDRREGRRRKQWRVRHPIR